MSIHPVQQQILDRLAALPASLGVLREHATRYAGFCSSLSIDETLQIGHQPWDGPESYAIRFYTPAKKAWFATFKKQTGRAIPAPYQEFLLAINGCTIHDLDLFGLPPSMQGRTPLLDRTRSQPLDLGRANEVWIHSYTLEPGEFHFGSRAWTDEENIGYFWSERGLRSIRTSGEVVGVWSDLAALLAEELPLTEATALEEVPAEWWH